MTTSLEGKVAVISGAGSGIGRAMARLFAAAGAAVVGADINGARIAEVVAEIAATGGRITGVTADTSTEDGVRAMLDRAEPSFGPIDILCNNAGITDSMTQLHETTDAHWERVMAINLTGPFRACRAALPGMLARGGGIIVNTASIAGFLGGRSGVAYTASKHGILGLTRSVATTYGERGIRCNAISPGSVRTNIGTAAPPSTDGLELRRKGLATRPPQAEPEEIAEVALFLASDAARYMNGANIVVDKGWTVY